MIKIILINIFFIFNLYANTTPKTVEVGIHIYKISEIDLSKKSANIDFEIWFKHTNKIDFTQFYFQNAIDKFDFTKTNKFQTNKYRRYHFNGKFKLDFDTSKVNATKFLLGFQLMSKMKDINTLLFKINDTYMNSKTQQSLLSTLNNNNIFTDSSWKTKYALFYTDITPLDTFAQPNLSKNNAVSFKTSSVNLNIIIDNSSFDLIDYISTKQAIYILILSIISILLLSKYKKSIYRNKFLKLIEIPVTEETIFNLQDKININVLKTSIHKIENILTKSTNTPMTNQQQYVVESSLEMIENMIKHSMNSTDASFENKEVKASFQINYDKARDLYTLKSCNIIDKSTKHLLQEKYNNLMRLDDKELRKLSRAKLKRKKIDKTIDSEIGYIFLFRRSTKPMNIHFQDINDSAIKFYLEVRI